MQSQGKDKWSLQGFTGSQLENRLAAPVSGPRRLCIVPVVSACITILLIWMTGASLAEAQSCMLYEANTGLAAESPYETTSQAAANDLVEFCNSGVPANRACFSGYS